MSKIHPEYLYSKSHEWVRKTGNPKVVVVGISDFAQASLGDVTFLQLPAVGTSLKKGDVFGSVESVKAVSDLYMPVSGKISKINDALVSDPAPVNTDAFDKAWMIEIEIDNAAELSMLLTATAYESVAQ